MYRREGAVVIDWPMIENAIQAAVLTGSGLPKVIWADQPYPRPARPYGTLKRISARDSSPFDEQRFSFGATQPVGQEIAITTIGPRTIVVSFNAYSDVVTGAGTAAEYCEALRSTLSLPATLDALHGAGVSLIRRGDTRDLSKLVETAFESRAQLDLTIAVTDTATQQTGHIATATLVRHTS